MAYLWGTVELELIVVCYVSRTTKIVFHCALVQGDLKSFPLKKYVSMCGSLKLVLWV
jgi:hypothetical protein